MGEIRVLTQKGDERIEWDPADKRSTQTAKAEFDRLKKDGYKFYEVTEARGKEVTRWDARAGRLLAAPGARSTTDKTTGTRRSAMSGGPNTTRARLS